MIAGVVGVVGMRVTDGRPSQGGMAYVTFLRGDEMRGGFSDRRRAVVTGTAIAGDTLVIERAADESRRGMAV